MKYYILAATFSLLTVLAAPVFAFGDQDHSCQGGHNCNTTHNNQTYNNPSAHAKASLKARLSSNARSNARSSSSSYSKSVQGQAQGQISSVKNVGPQIVDNSTVTYEASAVPPSLGQGDPGYDCSMTGGIGGAAVGFGGSVQWTDASINCELGMLYRLGKDDPDVRDRALDAYDVLYSRVLNQAAGDKSTKRDPSLRDGR